MLRLIDFRGVAHPISDYTRYHIVHKEDGCDEMSFYLETKHKQYPLMQEEAIIRTDQNEYLIKKVDDEKIDCRLNFDFLKQRTYLNYKSETQSLTSVLEAHMPSGWTIEGASVSTIRRTIEFDTCTDYDVIYECQKVYSVKFVWKILERRLIVFKPELMPSTGEYVTTELNLVALSFKGESTSFATRLYAYGKDGMTLEDAIVDGHRYGKAYVDNNDYCDKIVCAIWKDERYTIPENLYEATVEKLAAMAAPVRSYECKVRDLAKQDARYTFLTFSMHRKLTLIDVDRGIRVEHQIVEYDEWPDDENQNTVTLSCVQDTIYTSIKEASENSGKEAAEHVQQELVDFIENTYTPEIQSIQNDIDGKVETFYQATDPAATWLNVETRAKHVGDLWYNTSDQKYYIYEYDSTTQTYSWEEMTATPPDSVVAVIEAKAQVFTSQPTPPYKEGDLWFASENDDILTCVTTRSSGNFTAADWQKKNKYTDDTAANAYTDEQLAEKESEITQALTERLNMATAMLTAAFGGNIYQYNGEMFIMDDPDPAQAEVVWRWNINGFGKSSTGINGPYTMAMTVDDSFFANVISAMTIRGDFIEANTISGEKIQQSYTDGVLSSAFTAAKTYVEALFSDLNNYLSNTDGTGQLDVLRADITRIQATIDGLNIDFTESFRGGINYCQNSAGLNGMSDDWTATGTVAALQNSDTKNYTVSNSCFRLSADATLSQIIDNLVIGVPYTISCKVKKTGTLASSVSIVYNGSSQVNLFSQSTTTDGWEEVSVSLEAVQSGTLQISATTRSDYLYVSDIMVCEGNTSKAWTPAPEEIYTSGVKIDKRGITVYRSGTSEKTVIDNHEFSGYYNDVLVFTLNKDETQLQKTYVKEQLRFEDVVFIKYESGEEKGLNIALLD